MKNRESIFKRVGDYITNAVSKNVQMGTDASIEGMDLLKWKADRVKNVGFEQSKGNLFEYIEAAKLQRNMGNKAGIRFDKNPITDVGKHKGGYGENTAPDDLRMAKNGRIVGRAQAKVNNDPHKTAVNFVNKKYMGMQRLAPSDMVSEIHKQLDQMVAKGEISRVAYNDAIKNLQYDGVTDPVTGISSGGTTTEELYSLCGKDGKVSTEAVKKYAKNFEFKQYKTEVVTTAKNGAISGSIMGGVVSGVQNMCAILSDEKNLNEAVKDIGIDAAKSGIRGGAVGGLGAAIRIAGTKNGIPVIDDSTAAITIAGGVIDSGAAIYSYAKGEITANELKEELVDTTVKSTTTIFIMKGLGIALKSVGPLAPMVAYSVASQMVTAARTIINNAKINAMEYDRVANLLKDSVRVMQNNRNQMNQYMMQLRQEQNENFAMLLNGFMFDPVTGNGYDETVNTITQFADRTGIKLQHTDFDEYCNAMSSDDAFVLK